MMIRKVLLTKADLHFGGYDGVPYKYVDVQTGKTVKLQRGAPCSLRRMPDYAFRYISPGPKKLDSEELSMGAMMPNLSQVKSQKRKSNYTAPKNRNFKRKVA